MPQFVNKVNDTAFGRRMLDKTLGVHPTAPIPDYHSVTGRKRVAQGPPTRRDLPVTATAETKGKVALFATCYCNRNEPDIADDLALVFRHNGIPVTLVPREQCCGMPKLELGDLESIDRAKNVNIPALAAMVDQGYDLVAPVPSCALMFKQELPLLYPDDPDGAQGAGSDVRSVRIPGAAAQGWACCAPISRNSWARSATTSRATCACRISGSRRATC